MAVVACEGGQQQLSLDTVRPNLAASDRDTTLQLTGSFYAPVGADLGSGHQYLQDEFEVELGGVPLDDVSLVSETSLTALMPAGFAEGDHDLVVRDPLGRQAELARAVRVLPPDEASPVVTFLEPSDGSSVRVGDVVDVVYSVVDSPPGSVVAVAWSVSGAVQESGESELESCWSCSDRFAFEVLPTTTFEREIRISVVAFDDAPVANQGSAVLTLELDLCEDFRDCDDGLICNGVELCDGGACIQGEPIDCDDRTDCTGDVCDELSRSCYHIPNDSVCDNGVFCDGAEICVPAVGCVDGAPPCDDGVECTTDTCDEGPALYLPGECSFVPDDLLCQDRVFCNGAEVCSPGDGCVLGTDPCQDDIECTTNRCDEPSQSCHVDVDNSICDDNFDCTTDICIKEVGCVNEAGIEGPEGSPSCADGIDNDCDGDTDGVDPGC
jgi:hypothetical protein